MPTTCPNASLLRTQVSCSECSLSRICVPLAVQIEELDQLDKIIKRSKPLNRGSYLFKANEPFTAIYAVRTGAVKSYTLENNGNEQITGFYLPGEILGLDGINTNKHSNYAKALETTTICEIPFNRLEDLSSKIPSLQRHIFQLMSKEIQEDQQLILLLSKKTAEERIAALLLSLSVRNSRRKLSGQAIRLPMSRNDMGSYLGLAVETVSRVFTRFQQQDILTVDGKEVVIKNHNLLHQYEAASA